MDNKYYNFQCLEKVISALKYFLLAAALVLLLGQRAWWPDFYSPTAYGLAFLISAIIIVISGYAFRPAGDRDGQGRDAAIFLRFVIAFAFALNAIGELYLYQLYKIGLPFDKLLHFSASALFVIAITNYNYCNYKFTYRKALGEAIIIVLFCSLLWEAVEYLSDTVFHTKEFGIYGERKFFDTSFDLFADLIGITSSVIFLESSVLRYRLRQVFQRKEPIRLSWKSIRQ